MKIQEKIEQKREYLQKLINNFQATQANLGKLSEEIHETNGALKVLEELQKGESKNDSFMPGNPSEAAINEVKDKEDNKKK